MTHIFWSKKIFLFLLPITLLGQPSKNNLKQLTYDNLKKLYFDNEKNQKKQIEYANAYLEKAQKENNKIRIAKGYYQFALLNYQNNYSKAISYLDSVIKYSEDGNDKNFPAAAFVEKSAFLIKQGKFNDALKNLKIAETNALKKQNLDYYYIVRFAIATTKSEDLGEIEEALIITKECYDYYKSKDPNQLKHYYEYLNVIFALADMYKSLNQVQTSTYYNKLGWKESKRLQQPEYFYLFVLNEGANQVLKKNYKAALDSISKALPKMIEFKNIDNTLASYYYLGKAYEGLRQKELTVLNYSKVDSLYNQRKEITEEFVSGYPYLISYYKNNGDQKKQLHYLSTYMTIENKLQKDYKKWNKLLEKEYDMPHLVKEKETLIESLEMKQTLSFCGLGIFFLITITAGSIGYNQYRQKKTYRTKFDEIIAKSNVDRDTKRDFSNKNKDIGIAMELVNQILDKLHLFETQKNYLQANITIHELAQEFGTNNKYLSKIINEYKNKSFIQYINDLRIEYAISSLHLDRKLRKYTLQALAIEFGFNNAESFSAAFSKKTGLKPSFFIKELEKL